MVAKTNDKMIIQGVAVGVKKFSDNDYISLTDMLTAKDGEFYITDWLRNGNTLDYIGIWEKIHNPDFNYGEFATIRMKAGSNKFKIGVQEFCDRTNAISIKSTAGRYGGTYAHTDIAFEFGMWISPEFKIYLVKEFKRLKEKENEQLVWTVRRELSKINYRLQTDAVKQNIVPVLTEQQKQFVYQSEADRLNVALFGKTALEWRKEHKAEADKGENIRDYATHLELLVLANMENLNADMIRENIPAKDRTQKLNEMARYQMQLLIQSNSPILLDSKKS